MDFENKSEWFMPGYVVKKKFDGIFEPAFYFTPACMFTVPGVPLLGQGG